MSQRPNLDVYHGYRAKRSQFCNIPPTPAMVAEIVDNPPDWVVTWRVWMLLRLSLPLSKMKVAAFGGMLGILDSERVGDLDDKRAVLLSECIRAYGEAGGGTPAGKNLHPASFVLPTKARLADQLQQARNREIR